MGGKNWTPGPWSYDGTGPHNVFGCDILSSGGDSIAGSWHGRSDTAQANAHLIAAAPDLYGALEWAREALKSANIILAGQDREDCSFIDAALAKARGEA